MILEGIVTGKDDTGGNSGKDNTGGNSGRER